MTTGSWNHDTLWTRDNGSWNGDNGKYDSLGKPKENYYHKVVQTASLGPYHTRYDNCNGDNAMNVTPNLSPSYTANTKNSALGKLASNIRESNDVDLGNFLATGVQAYDQTLSSLWAIGKGLRGLQRGDLSATLAALGMVAGQRKRKHLNKPLKAGDISAVWLAIQYGWLPTLQDIYGLWNAWSAKQAKYRSYTFHSSSRSGYDSTFNHQGAWEAAESGMYHVHYKYVVTESLSTARALGLYDPAGILWEITPWSFVVDWFLPISTYLDNLSVFPYLSGQWCSSEKTVRNVSFKRGLNYYYTCPNAGGSNVWSKNMSFTRLVGSGELPVPNPTFKSLPASLSGAHLRNAAALIHQSLISNRSFGGKFSPV